MKPDDAPVPGHPLAPRSDVLLLRVTAFRAASLDVFGMGAAGLAERPGIPPGRCSSHADLPTGRLYDRPAHRRHYVHPVRWTSLGLSLIEAMYLGMPVAAVDRLSHEPETAATLGRNAREAALTRYGLPRFLADRDPVIERVVRHELTGDRS